LPPEILADSVLHTWTSFSGSLEQCIIHHHLTPALEGIRDLRVCLIHGTEDAFAPAEHVRSLALRYPNLQSRFIEGADHNAFLSHTQLCLDIVRDYARAGS